MQRCRLSPNYSHHCSIKAAAPSDFQSINQSVNQSEFSKWPKATARSTSERLVNVQEQSGNDFVKRYVLSRRRNADSELEVF